MSFAAAPTNSSNSSAEVYDVVITNGRVIDGAGNPWFRADVGIKDGRVEFIGRIDRGKTMRVIDAKDQMLSSAPRS